MAGVVMQCFTTVPVVRSSSYTRDKPQDWSNRILAMKQLNIYV